MIIDVILGVNMDTEMWITELMANKAEMITVLDFDYFGEPKIVNNVTYISAFDLKKLIKNYDKVYFYKSIYFYPILRD